MLDAAFGLSCAKPGGIAIHQEGIPLVSPESNVIFMLVFPFCTETYQIAVHHFAQRPAAFQCDYTQSAGRNCFIISFVTLH